MLSYENFVATTSIISLIQFIANGLMVLPKFIGNIFVIYICAGITIFFCILQIIISINYICQQSRNASYFHVPINPSYDGSAPNIQDLA